ncbi:MAG: hypothetical protein HRT72_01740 [Flavobacteriales bacterium]|nr:hypothetical protein [Flavobacteriales bacterium]
MRLIIFFIILLFASIIGPEVIYAQKKVAVKLSFGIPSITVDKEYKNGFEGQTSIGLTAELEVFKFLTAGGFYEYNVFTDNVSSLPQAMQITKSRITAGGLVLGNEQKLKEKYIIFNYIKAGYAFINFKHRSTRDGNYSSIYKSDGRLLGIGSNLNYLIDNKTEIGIFFNYNFVDYKFDVQHLLPDNTNTASKKTQYFNVGINVTKKF